MVQQKCRFIRRKERLAVYPGSFDPVTNGHIDIIERSLKFIDRLIVTVAQHPAKNPLFSFKERMEMLGEIFQNRQEVMIDSFDGLLVNYLEKKGVYLVIRGLRAVSDFDYEFQMVLTNRKLLSRIETIFLTPKEEYLYLSSSAVKEIAKLKGPVERFVPEIVAEKLKEKYRSGF
ncbi:MAG: pantetheine-phosphate adenylyltransferase [Candidatus Omnitrophica bacterium]|nr:pantetheine-phosphate adenylyltransferase [Candidatus Omnitrophota bacterium]MCM8825402.1 pantetheine-phosphate adenylyltransferase [Candidatus Omnitrophota bacterium]